MLCIFGGTAAYYLTLSDFTSVGETVQPDTPFGESVPFTQLTIHDSPPHERISHGEGPGVGLWFASRHGRGSLSRSARFVNHRANVWVARELGCDAILSWNGVGAINPDLAVNDLVVPDDLLDMTRARISDFGFQISDRRGEHQSDWRDQLVHPPFSEQHRQALINALRSTDSNPQSAIRNPQSFTYVCTEGPRLETPAEIRAYRELGADVVGMTLSPEVWLAAELGLAYASLCYVTNIAAGLAGPDSERNFSPAVGVRCLEILLRAAKILDTGD